MKNKIKLMVCFVFLLTTLYAQKKPNVIFILTDQWRSSALGYAGNDVVQTPNLDQFAKEAINVTNTVSVTPVCTPHRAALFTGRYPTTTGMFLNDIYLPSEELCMAEIYKKAGYNTAYIGKWHLDGHGREENVAPNRRQGFEYWKGTECSHDYNRMLYFENQDTSRKYWQGYSTFAMSNDAQNYAAEHANDKNPFLLVVSLATPHFPHNTAPAEYQALYPDEKLKLEPNVPANMKQDVFKELRGYYGHCTATDKAIGDLIAKLKALKIYDNSIIVFTADHGEMMGSHGSKPGRKQLAWNESAHVPFLISYPGIGKNKGKKLNAAITTPDILPSLLSFSSIAIPKTIQGQDVSSLLKTADPNVDRPALFMNICPFESSFKETAFRAIRTKEYTYVKNANQEIMLFDDVKDPYQLTNLAGKDSFKEVQAKLDAQLKKELIRIGDAEIKDRNYYLNKFGFRLNAGGKNIKYNYAPGEKRIVQSPKIKE